MPYDALGKPVTVEELKKEAEYQEKHATRIAVANAVIPIMAVGFFVAGVVSIGSMLIGMIASGVAKDTALGVMGLTAIVGSGVFGIVNARYDAF